MDFQMSKSFWGVDLVPLYIDAFLDRLDLPDNGFLQLDSSQRFLWEPPLLQMISFKYMYCSLNTKVIISHLHIFVFTNNGFRMIVL